jgi:SulP family sulfate permease
MSLFPRPVLGALIVFMGLGLLVEWLYDGWFRLSLTDYLLVIVILVVIAFLGVLPGVAAGTLAAVVIFAVNYGRTEVVYQQLTGREVASNVDRPAKDRRMLREGGGRILVLKLRGFVFFGTAYSVYQAVRSRLADPALGPLSFLILDLRRVRGLDGSAEMALARILGAARQNGIALLLVSAAKAVSSRLRRSRAVGAHADLIRYFPDLDHGLEWCEDRILEERHLDRAAAPTGDRAAASSAAHQGTSSAAHQGGPPAADQADPSAADQTARPRGDLAADPQALQELLGEIFGSAEHARALAPLLEEVRVEAKEPLIRQGEAADRLFFVASGEFAVYLARSDEQPLRLRTMRPGAVFGEIALYLGIPRSVSVVATRPSLAYALTADALARLEREDKDLSIEFQRYLIRLLAERLADVNRTLRALAD